MKNIEIKEEMQPKENKEQYNKKEKESGRGRKERREMYIVSDSNVKRRMWTTSRKGKQGGMEKSAVKENKM